MDLAKNSSGLSVAKEFSGALLGDERRTRRLRRIAERLEANPAAGLPKALGTVAEREAAYKFLNTDAVSLGAILEPHLRATAERCAGREVLAIHDTTRCQFDTPAVRRGLGKVLGKTSP